MNSQDERVAGAIESLRRKESELERYITSKLGESSPSVAVLGPCHDKGLTGSGGRRTATEESRRRLVRNASWLLLSELRLPSKLSSCHWSCVRRRRQRMGNLGQSTTSKQRWFHR